MPRSFRPKSKDKRKSSSDAAAVIEEGRVAAAERGRGYRARSLRIHGWICALCTREFDASNLHQLTVHHRDGNHHNNPPDGSNWENLCVYCHDHEHSRDLHADYLSSVGKKE